MNRTPALRVTWWDRFLLGIAPQYGQRRIEARARVQLMARHYEAAQGGRRTDGWRRTATDANAANGPALATLRELARDLRRNNGWAANGIRVITRNTIGWGIMPKPAKDNRRRSERALRLWNTWATSTSCDYDGRLNFYGIQRLAMETVVESGEVLIVKQPAPAADGLAIPMRLQVLEPDYLDSSRHGLVGLDGGPIIHGVEFDRRGRRVAYWLFSQHPGGNQLPNARFASERIPADRVLHVYRVDRPGQVRGVPWLASAIARLRDLDDYEDAELMQAKIASCFAAFVTDLDGSQAPMGATGEDSHGNPIESLEPGHIAYLKPGQDVKMATPPRAQDGAFTTRNLRRIAASLPAPYEELTGDYSQVNFSSARMSRLAHWASVGEWREHMIVPQLCAGVWRWAMEDVSDYYGWPVEPTAEWAAPPMPILEPDKEGLAYQRLLRIGAMTWPQMIRELGYDPIAQLDEIEQFNRDADERGLVFDSDPRRMSSAGQAQLTAGAGASDPSTEAATDAADDATDAEVADTAETDNETEDATVQ